MFKSASNIQVKAPGRICLLGEHQDYLGLEVLSGALNLSVYLEATPDQTTDNLTVNLLQTGKTKIIHLTDQNDAPRDRDYLLSGYEVMRRTGLTFSSGWIITVTGDLPIGKGVSSSSALCVGWIKLLSAICDNPVDLTPMDIALLAFQTEVKEFNEPGGMQDHLASALGGLLYLNFKDSPDMLPEIKQMQPIPKGFLLVDSGESKETIGMISRIRNRVEHQARLVWQTSTPRLSLQSVTDVMAHSGQSFPELLATLQNRDQVRYALTNWPQTPDEFPEFLADLINTHHTQLANGIGTSSPTINRLIHLARSNGAVAGKVIGSGGGGCVLLYAPNHQESVTSALVNAGARIWPVTIGRGVSFV